MSLDQLLFVFVFFPVSLLLYRIVPPPGRKPLLLLLSMLFIALGNPGDLLLILLSIAFNYFTALQIERLRSGGHPLLKRLVLLTGVTGNVLLLLYFKYSGFLWDNLAAVFGVSHAVSMPSVPIGISFFTFSALSCLLDVSCGREKPLKHPLDFALYITFFAKIVSGPIVPYHQMAAQLREPKSPHAAAVEQGIRRFLIGLSKKIMIANNLGLLYASLGELPVSSLSAASAWLKALSYSFMLYFDFSGYSDMAIGLSETFGFSFGENFRYPYLSVSISDFWRRWHISLGAWFREYVYIPLGGNRKGKAANIRNLLLVWLLTGIWHGANWTFIVWGFYHGLLVVLEKFVLRRPAEKLPAALRCCITFLLAVVGWTIFCADNLASALTMTAHMLGIGGALLDGTALYYLTDGGVLLLIAALGATPLLKTVGDRLSAHDNLPMRVLTMLFFALLLTGCTMGMISNTYSSFLYARF